MLKILSSLRNLFLSEASKDDHVQVCVQPEAVSVARVHNYDSSRFSKLLDKAENSVHIEPETYFKELSALLQLEAQPRGIVKLRGDVAQNMKRIFDAYFDPKMWESRHDMQDDFRVLTQTRLKDLELHLVHDDGGRYMVRPCSIFRNNMALIKPPCEVKPSADILPFPQQGVA